jgi:hypothetical protein
MNNKETPSDPLNHLYRKISLLESENKQLREYVHLLRKVSLFIDKKENKKRKS